MTNAIGSTVHVGDTMYQVIDRRSTNGSGPKFFGKFVFTLVDNVGLTYTTYGKRVVWNSRLKAQS
jgi:hypothetical protein